MRSYGLALLSIALGAVGQFLLKIGADQLGSGRSLVQTVLAMFTKLPILIGLVLFGSSFILWVLVLRDAQLSTAYPLVSLSYVIIAVLSALVLHEPITALKAGGLALIIAGVVLIGLKA